MKKIIIFLLLAMLLVGCGEKKEKEINYSEYLFTNVSWTRDGGNDIETIRFNSDGSFSYYCSCGNPVNDSDLCESYKYTDETKEIKLDCFVITDEMITTIKVIESTDSILELDFNGEIRRFEKEN